MELRHQRTSDVLFDLANLHDYRGKSATSFLKTDTDPKTLEAVYRLIETLLPKAVYNPNEPKAPLQLMEL